LGRKTDPGSPRCIDVASTDRSLATKRVPTPAPPSHPPFAIPGPHVPSRRTHAGGTNGRAVLGRLGPRASRRYAGAAMSTFFEGVTGQGDHVLLDPLANLNAGVDPMGDKVEWRSSTSISSRCPGRPLRKRPSAAPRMIIAACARRESAGARPATRKLVSASSGACRAPEARDPGRLANWPPLRSTTRLRVVPGEETDTHFSSRPRSTAQAGRETPSAAAARVKLSWPCHLGEGHEPPKSGLCIQHTPRDRGAIAMRAARQTTELCHFAPTPALCRAVGNVFCHLRRFCEETERKRFRLRYRHFNPPSSGSDD